MADRATGSGFPHADMVVESAWRPRVEQEAGRCRHSFLDNVFVVLDDASLAEWLDDEEAVRSFLTCAHFVCEHVDLYSPVAMLPRIRPLDRLRRADLLQLRETLAELFEQRFRPHVVERELRERLDALLATMKSVSLGGATSSELALVRAAARALQARMTRLPRGFWLPGSPLTG